MLLDRDVAPALGGVGNLPSYSVEQGQLSNGIKTRLMRRSGLGVAMLQLFFPRGAAHTLNPAAAQMAVRLLQKGSKRMGEAEINEFYDHRGSLVNYSLLPDYVEVRVVALAEYFEETVLLALETVESPAMFPVAVESVRGQLRQQYAISELETSYIAHWGLMGRLFPVKEGVGGYGCYAKSSDFEGITLNEIEEFHRRAFATQGAKAFLAGDFSPDCEKALLARLQGLQLPYDVGYPSLEHLPTGKNTTGASWYEERISMQDKQQSSISVGCLLPIETPGISAATPELRQAVALLGGYFTSRLMQNLREDKGYTYGVRAQILERAHGAALVISSDVGKGYVPGALAEIQREMQRMSSDPPSENELLNLRGYMQNRLMGYFDGTLSAALALRRLLLFPWLGDCYFDRLKKSIDGMDTMLFSSICRQIFTPSNYSVVIAGEE